MLHLGDRNVEASLQPSFQTIEKPALFLKAPTASEMKLKAADPDDHDLATPLPGAGRAGPKYLEAGCSETGSNLLEIVRLEHIADLDIVEVLQRNATLEALLHFAHIFLEPTQGANLAVVDDA